MQEMQISLLLFQTCQKKDWITEHREQCTDWTELRLKHQHIYHRKMITLAMKQRGSNMVF